MTETERTAAEYALGLLEGEELLAARARMAAEPEFARAVAFWEERLAPMIDDIGGAEPSPEVWARIEAELENDDAQTGEVIALRQRVTFWQRMAAGGAIAAAFALAFIALPQFQSRQDGAPQIATNTNVLGEPPLAAAMPIDGTDLRLSLAYVPATESLLVTALGIPGDGVHDHEIWLVPEEGELISLGVVTPDAVAEHSLPFEVGRQIASGSRLVLTREPIGGKPPERAAGPVVAEGTFSTI